MVMALGKSLTLACLSVFWTVKEQSRYLCHAVIQGLTESVLVKRSLKSLSTRQPNFIQEASKHYVGFPFPA